MYRGGTEIYNSGIVTSTDSFSLNLEITDLQQDEALYFHVNFGVSNASGDETQFDPVITYVQ